MFGFRKMSSTLALLLAAVLSISAGASANTDAAPSLEVTKSVFMAYAESHDVKYVTDDVIFFNAADRPEQLEARVSRSLSDR
jgi:ABC-type glycerol-3-phosphate transport system substrate-binding protein